jgi:hypothetical protein
LRINRDDSSQAMDAGAIGRCTRSGARTVHCPVA